MVGLGGYVGRLLHVDLRQGELTAERPDEALLRSFIGGYGLGARILYERMPAGADPLGPDNILGFVTGPLTGTPALLSGRFCVVGKSPLTGTWGDANSGGKFGPGLKFAGYDAVFVSGVSQEPVYLLIEEGQASLRSADDLWGLDCIETDGLLKDRHGKGTEVASIGPPGERLALISCIITDRGRAAARSGLGAVMGSKQLKAVAVRGTQKPVVMNQERVKELRAHHLPALRSGVGEALHAHGTAGFTEMQTTIGRTPIKNWAGWYPDGFRNVQAIDGAALSQFEKRKYACWGCGVGCGAELEWQEDGRMFTDHRPEYETVAAFGTYCAIDDLRAVMRMNEICNRNGLDTISAGATIAFAMECYENGVFTQDELDGLKLEWGDGQAATELLRRMVERHGLGDVLVDGVRRASDRLDRGSEVYAIHAGGQELPAQDPRQASAYGLQYQMAPTPGRHTQGGMLRDELPPQVLAALGVDPKLQEDDPLQYQTQAYAAGTAWLNVLNAAGLCQMGLLLMGFDHVPQYVAAVTGWDFDMAECLEAGERIELVRHLFGLREGHNPLDVEVPSRVLGRPPLEAGPTAGVTVELDELRNAYLKMMDWDPQTAMPSGARLAGLGLDALVALEEPVRGHDDSLTVSAILQKRREAPARYERAASTIQGVVVAPFLPFDDRKQLEEDVLSAYLDKIIDAGPDALYCLGTCQEFPVMTLDQRMEVAETIMRLVAERVPVVIQVGTNALDQTIELARHAQEVGADAVYSVPPYYFTLDDRGLITYFTELAEAINIPVHVYDIPSMTKVKFSPPVLAEIGKHPRITAMKDSTEDMTRFELLVQQTGLDVFQGSEALILASLVVGAAGCVCGGAGTIFPELPVRLLNAFERRDLDEALEIQRKVIAVLTLLLGFESNVLHAVKACIGLRWGFEMGRDIVGFTPLSKEELERLDRGFKELLVEGFTGGS
jgi:aldehyde:ferredoxin oxidoreductase